MIKTLLKSVREFKVASIITPLLVFFEVILECIIPMVIAEMVKLIEEHDTVDIPTVLKYGLVVVLLALLSLSFGTIAGITAAKASCGFAKNLRHDLFYAVQDFSFENIDKISTSSLVTRLTTDINNVQNAFMMVIRMAIRSPFMFIFAIVAAFMTGGKLAWIFVVVVPILGTALLLVAKNEGSRINRVVVRAPSENEGLFLPFLFRRCDALAQSAKITSPQPFMHDLVNKRTKSCIFLYSLRTFSPIWGKIGEFFKGKTSNLPSPLPEDGILPRSPYILCLRVKIKL